MENGKQSLMPPPVFTSVPSLPMFLVESGGNKIKAQTDYLGPLNIHSTSDVTSGGIELDAYERLYKKHTKKQNQTVDKLNSVEDGNKGEIFVRPRRHHHHHRHKSHKSSSDALEVISNEGIPPQSEIPVELETKSRRKALISEKDYSGNNTMSLKDLDDMSRENDGSVRNLQVSHSGHDSGYHQISTTDEMSHKKENLEMLKSKLSKLQSSFKKVERQRDACEVELSNMKSQQKVDFEKMSTLQTQNQELNEDVIMLKNLVYRLNVELDRYQQRHDKQSSKNELPPIKAVPATVQEKEAALLWNSINMNALKPLLDAYEETIREKDDLIKKYEQDLNKFVTDCKQVVNENEKLYGDLDEANKHIQERSGSWEAIQQDAKIAEEQNELLLSQVQLQKDKLKELEAMYEEKVSELTKDNEMLVNKFHQYRGDLLTLKGQYSVLREEYDKLKKDAENKVPFAVHSASVEECKRLFEELKAKYEGDKSNLTSQVQELQSQKPHLEVQLEKMIKENKELQIHVKTLDKLLKKTQQRCEELQSHLVTCQVSRDTSRRQLKKAMAFAEELVAEQEKLLCQLHAKQEENNSITRLGTTIVCRMGTLKTKLKTVQKDAWAELDVVEKRIRRQETDVERMKDEYHHEVLRLRNLVKQKEVIIGRLQREKMKTEEDLEVVWRAATSEDHCIKEKLKQARLLPEKELYL